MKSKKTIETHVFCNYGDGICAACTKTTVFLGYFTSGQNEKSFLKWRHHEGHRTKMPHKGRKAKKENNL